MALKKSLIIGLTGGIGSGKTTVAQVFNYLEIPVYNSDERAKFLMNTHPYLIQNIKNLFGEDSYQLNGELNKKLIGEKAFSNPEILPQLNQLVHPIVALDFDDWVQSKYKYKLVMKEAAILFESGSFKTCDKVILVTAPEDIRIKRVVKRSGLSIDEVKKRISSQWTDDKKRLLADYILINDGEKLLIPQILEINQELKNLK